MDLSNKSLALILVASILLSLGGTIFTLNQMSEGTTGLLVGIVNLSIGANLVCDVPNNISFGAGTQPATSYMLSSEANNNLNGFSADCTSSEVCSGILINNTGNVEVNVSFSSNVNGSSVTFLAGVDSDYIYTWYNGTGRNHAMYPGCVKNATQPYGNWTNVTTLTTYVCNNLSYGAANKHIVLEFNTTIRSTTTAGTKTSTLTITCQRP